MLLKYQPFLSPTCTAWVIVFHNFTAPTSHQQQSATDILQNCHIKSLHLWARCPKCNICIPRSYDSLHQATGYAHTHTHLTALFLGLPRWAGTRKVKQIWILLKKETVSGSGISWAICKSATRSRQTPPLKIFTGQMNFLPPNQQHQSTEGITALL